MARLARLGVSLSSRRPKSFMGATRQLTTSGYQDRHDEAVHRNDWLLALAMIEILDAHNDLLPDI